MCVLVTGVLDRHNISFSPIEFKPDFYINHLDKLLNKLH